MSKENATFDAAELKAAIKENSDEVKALVEKSNEEIAKLGKTSEATVNELEELTQKGEKMDERLAAIEQAQHGQEDGGDTKSYADEWHEKDSFQAMKAGNGTATRLETKTTLVNATLNSSQPLVPADHLPGAFSAPFRQFSVWDALPKGATSSNLISFARATRTNNAGPQVAGSPLVYTEGATKPESAYSFALVERPVVTLSHFLPVSTQIMEDAPFLESWLRNDMVNGLLEKVEGQALLGSGASGNLSGVVTEATAFADTSPIEASQTDVVRIRSAIRQLEIANFMASHIVLNPTDWYRMEVARINAGTDDRFIWSNPQNAADKRLWGVPVIVTNAMTAGSYLVGDFGAAMVFEKGGVSFQAAYQDSDNFQKNLVTLRAETRLSLIVKRTEAFVTGTLP